PNIETLGMSSASSEKDSEREAYSQVIDYLRDNGLITVNKEKIQRDDNKVGFSVVLTKKHLDFINKFGHGNNVKDALKPENRVNITDPVIGYAEAPTKTEADHKAYDNALITLKKHGISLEGIRNRKRLSDMLENPTVFPHTEKAFLK